jgi:hypothetical protein
VRREELPAAWQGDAPILCVAGRGPLDDTASAMLAQLLGKHGLAAHTVSHAAISRSKAGSFAADGVAMICVTYLEIDGHFPHLRHLLRRLHQRLPKVPLLIAPDAFAEEGRLRAGISADFHASSLREAVQACVRAATKDAEPSGAASQPSRPNLTVVAESQ